MDELEHLARVFRLANSPDIKRQVLASALVHPQLDSFVLEHSEGWQGDCGQLARVLCRMLQTI